MRPLCLHGRLSRALQFGFKVSTCGRLAGPAEGGVGDVPHQARLILLQGQCQWPAACGWLARGCSLQRAWLPAGAEEPTATTAAWCLDSRRPAALAWPRHTSRALPPPWLPPLASRRPGARCPEAQAALAARSVRVAGAPPAPSSHGHAKATAATRRAPRESQGSEAVLPGLGSGDVSLHVCPKP